jgi:phenylacetate-CoA ligase
LGYLQRTQYLPRRTIKRIQEERLKLLLRYAFQNIPFYHKLFKSRSLKPSDIKSTGDLSKLPVVTKHDFRNNFNEFLSQKFKRHAILHSTGGSTGEPFKFFISRKTISIANAALWRGWGYAGYKLGNKMAVLGGLSLIPSRRGLLRMAIKRVMNRTVDFPAINIRREILEKYTKMMINHKPEFIQGYPSSLYFFGDFLREENISEIRPRAILTTAEMLFPYQRRLIEDVFSCPVFDGYGMFDGGAAAFECEEHCGYHMAVEKTVMEFVDADGNLVSEEENGRIVATDLFNYAMPFIRYDTGDMGVYSSEKCSCKRTLPLMKKILGRTTDILRFKTGAVLSGPSLTLIFKDFDIKQYQVVQTEDDSMVIKIVKGKGYNDEDSRNLHHIFDNVVGNGVKVELDFVDHITPTKSGKWKIIIRDVKE